MADEHERFYVSTATLAGQVSAMHQVLLTLVEAADSATILAACKNLRTLAPSEENTARAADTDPARDFAAGFYDYAETFIANAEGYLPAPDSD